LRLYDGDAAASRWAAHRSSAAAARSSAAASSAPPASLLELAFELPSRGAAACRQALVLPLPSRVESARAALSLPPAGDHIAVRLPLFYSGAVSQRAARARTPVARGEVAALRARGAALACRRCRAPLMRQPLPHEDSRSGGGGAPPPLRAALLPSEHWLEWSDYWLCHADEVQPLLPSADYGAQRGALLIADAALQLHPADCGAAALRVATEHGGGGGVGGGAPLGALLAALEEEGRGGGGGGGGGSEEEDSAADAAAQAVPLYCACGAALGSTQLPPHRAAALLLRAAALGAGSVASACGAAERLPAKLAKARDPYVTLLKDALWLDADAGAAEGTAAAGAAAPVAEGSADNDWADCASAAASSNVFRSYTVVTRISESLYSSVLAHGQYTFVLAAAAAAEGGGGGGVPRLHLTISSWNSSVAWAAAGAPPRALRAALRVHYCEAAADGAADLLLSAAELASVAATLACSTAALPPSRAAIGGSRVGFLPLSSVQA